MTAASWTAVPDPEALLHDERLVWFLNRGSGVVLMALMTLSVVLGVLSTARTRSRFWPRFVTQAVHRNTALVTVALLAGHVLAAVVDDFVDIRWFDAFVPVDGGYRPFWLGLGALACDLVVVITATSLLRHRMRHRSWRLVHLSTYAGWALGLVHGLGIGTDTRESWSASVTVACVGVVAAAVVVRLATAVHERRLAV